jgi:hypothetical protein
MEPMGEDWRWTVHRGILLIENQAAIRAFSIMRTAAITDACGGQITGLRSIDSTKAWRAISLLHRLFRLDQTILLIACPK